jgi:dTMP kinase
MFFVFDGVDGAGKTTQIKLFVEWLESKNYSVVSCKDPGSTALGEELRRLLLDKHHVPIAMRAEMMMFTTARAQLVEEIIRPALEQQKMVVLDRYILSTVVYQGHAGQLDPGDVWRVNQIATNGLMPDVSFIFDLVPVLAFDRLHNRAAGRPLKTEHNDEQANGAEQLDRMESRGLEYFEKVRDGFLLEAERWPDRVEIIDASQSVGKVQQKIRELSLGYMTRQSPDKIL